jgi:hypothetical protein
MVMEEGEKIAGVDTFYTFTYVQNLNPNQT